jgi:DNA-binding response OmpR family regulator
MRHNAPESATRKRTAPATPDAASPRVLLADDDVEMRKLIAWALHREGYVVQECHDGNVLRKQLERSGTRSTNVAYDLVVTDIRMPGPSGLEVLERMQGQDSCPPMILISAFCDRETEDLARRLGAAALLPKPFAIEELVAQVHRVLPPDDADRPSRRTRKER